MAFEDKQAKIEKAFETPHFRAKPFAGKPHSNQGQRRIGRSYSLRPDLVATIDQLAQENGISASNLVERQLLKDFGLEPYQDQFVKGRND